MLYSTAWKWKGSFLLISLDKTIREIFCRRGCWPVRAPSLSLCCCDWCSAIVRHLYCVLLSCRRLYLVNKGSPSLPQLAGVCRWWCADHHRPKVWHCLPSRHCQWAAIDRHVLIRHWSGGWVSSPSSWFFWLGVGGTKCWTGWGVSMNLLIIILSFFPFLFF